MYRHLFLTGEKQVGKSTLIQKLLGEFSGTYGGFFTRRILCDRDGRMYTHLLRPGEVPSEENILFCCNGTNRYDPAKRFEQLGCAALDASSGAELIIMDELGPHEEDAVEFQKKVFEILDGITPVLGVLQKADSPFLEKITAHPAVRVVGVTMENRNELAAELKPK